MKCQKDLRDRDLQRPIEWKVMADLDWIHRKGIDQIQYKIG